MVFEYKKGTVLKTSAQVAGEMCDYLSKNGGLTPKRLVDANRAEDAPLHDEFEWDDEVAAEAYRETQASYIIRHIIIREDDGEEEMPTRAFVRVTAEPSTYTPMKVVMENPDMMEKLLEDAKRDMESFVRKYWTVSALADVVEVMQKAIANAG